MDGASPPQRIVDEEDAVAPAGVPLPKARAVKAAVWCLA